MARLSRLEVARAAIRLGTEQELTLLQACNILGAPPPVVIRWIVQGKSGRHLDGVLDPEKGWLTSREACARFLAGDREEAAEAG